MAQAVASVIFFGLVLLPHLCTSYQASYNPGSRRFIIHSLSNDESEALTSMPACSSIPSGPANENRLPLMHRDSPCSPLASAGKKNRQASSTDVFERDVQRLRTIFAVTRPGKADASAAAPAPAPASSGVTLPITGTDNSPVLGSLDYSVTVGFGTPAQKLPMDFDTLRLGSVSTLRCKPCRPGAAPCDPAFDPSMSSSFAGVACGPECPSLCQGSACSLNITFWTNHSMLVVANGSFIKDTLTLSPSATVDNFVLACIDVDRFHLFTRSSGLLDLSRSRFSLVSRLATSTSPADNTTAAFSYCLPASPASSRGFLSIGGALPDLSGGDAGSTPLVDNTVYYKNDYMVKLSGINVGGTELPIPATESSLAALEVGASLTFFVPAIYGALRDEFRKQMTKYTMAPPYRWLDTCYNFTGLPGFEVPGIILEFEGGATLQPDIHQMMYFVDGSFNYVCLAFGALPGQFPYSVIGNRAQQTVEVVYDVRGGKVGFIHGSC
ncbi:unnamed protein product [Urochloa decumbens]|uniref:Peptidase A1 domain-containing protein n=1 Tax=Urochloa decumbens TaxID=240449 RepID=A0ABC9DX39_9POAL